MKFRSGEITHLDDINVKYTWEYSPGFEPWFYRWLPIGATSRVGTVNAVYVDSYEGFLRLLSQWNKEHKRFKFAEVKEEEMEE